MPAKRFAFMIDKIGNQAIVSTDCGGGVIRARNMPLPFLDSIIAGLRQMKSEIIDMVSGDPTHLAQLPLYPKCSTLGGGNLGPCDIRVVGSMDESGKGEFCTALYDEGDYSAPVLVLINEQLDQFIARATAIMTPEGLN